MGYIYGNELNRLGKIDKDGYIYAENLQRIGRIHKDGYIYAENLQRIGRIDGDGYIYTENLQRIGRIDKDGTVYNESLKKIGRLDEDILSKVLHTHRTNTQEEKSTYSPAGIGGNIGCGTIIFIIVSIAVAFFFFPYMTDAFFKTGLIFVLLVIAAVNGFRAKKENGFKQLWKANFIGSMIFWIILSVMSIFGGNESVGIIDSIEWLITSVLMIPVGGVLMSVMSIAMAGISMIICHLRNEQ